MDEIKRRILKYVLKNGRLSLEGTSRLFNLKASSRDFLLAHAFIDSTAASGVGSSGMGPNGTGPCR
ncbi:MAG: hypothetical protein JZD41_00895, partial [Thermoproteus sp.]|nr:hypothetical protein [Thermoproteus sp.]